MGIRERAKSLSVAVDGPLIVDDSELVIRAALDGVGLAYVSGQNVAPHLFDETLLRILQDWCQPYPGYFLYYYSSTRQKTAALSALVTVLRA